MFKYPKSIKLFKESLYFLFMAFRKRKELSLITDQTDLIRANDILLFSTMKNEGHRLSFFLDYYRKLGINHFLIVDNGSTDNTVEFLAKQPDVTHFYTEGSYKYSNFGMHWLNYLLFKYGRNHWCFTCDPDELFVYPYMETRDLKDLTEYLGSIKQESFFTIMLDMYSDKPVSQSLYEPGTNPVDTCPYFDSTGYSKKYNHFHNNLYVQGGVRRRIFSINEPASAPALNKISLVNWKWNYVYLSSMHMMLPRHLNRCVDENKVTGALLHYKFISQLDEKVKQEILAKQHYNESAEYKEYDKVIQREEVLFDEVVSSRFVGWKDLAHRGLINIGSW